LGREVAERRGMSTLQEDLEREALLDRISEVSSVLREHVDGASGSRHELYPLLYEANVVHGMSLAQLQVKTGLTRGRIHQIVNLVKAQKTGRSVAAEPVAELADHEPESEQEDAKPKETAGTGWTFN
jgi:hypothetical protein